MCVVEKNGRFVSFFGRGCEVLEYSEEAVV